MRNLSNKCKAADSGINLMCVRNKKLGHCDFQCKRGDLYNRQFVSER